MARAVMDPGAVRRFAHALKQFSTEIQEQMGALHGRFSALGDTWQDEEKQKFAEEFEQTMRTLGRFVERANQHAPHLLRKAERIEEYLRQK